MLAQASSLLLASAMESAPEQDAAAMARLPRQIQPRTVANRNGPGPFLALIYKKTDVPTNRNTARITDG